METSTADFILGLLTRQPRIPDKVTWDSVLTETEAYRLGGLAWSVGGRSTRWGGEIPTPVLASWEAGYRTQALSNALLLEELAKLRKLFEGEGIPLGVVKGGQLLHAGIYPLGARPADDLDVVTPESCGRAAVELMMDSGWIPWSEDVLGTIGWSDCATFHASGQGRTMGLSVDLHWRTSYDRLRYGEPGAGARHAWDPRGGLRTEDHLVLTLEHFLKHLRYRSHLVALGDAARLAPAVRDWDRVAELLRRSTWGGAALALLSGLDGCLDREVVPTAMKREVRPGLRARFDPRSLVLRAGAPQRRLGGLALRWAATGPGALLTDLMDSVAPPSRWLEHRYGGGADTRLGHLRMRHLSRIFRWGIGSATSPLSPNQD
ncbi:MAG: nucleotidyltransferase family protein [Longimicrobiales bacterium]